LELRQGAAASNGAAAVAVTGGSSGAVLVTDSGTLWDCTGTLAVGKGGSGTMTVVSGAQVTCDDAIVAQELASVGAVLVNGTGSAWTILGSLDVGMTGVGTMTIMDGAAVTTDLFATLGTFTGPPFTDEHAVGEAVLDGAGSTLSVGGDLYVGLAGFGRWTLARGGQVIVAGDLVRGEWPEESKLPQTLIELGGAGEYSAAAISAGGAADGFDARVELSGGYVPSFGDTFFIAAAATILDPFTFDLPPLSPPVAWQVIQDATTVRLRVGRLGDLDGDDEVGITDFLSLLKTWGACAPGSFCPADLDGDGEVGVTDLLLLLGAWG
jgi:T5SS/PEP-CTERM-associated repeat protein